MDLLMKRLGFVRLDRYGLVLTPEGRIISMRPAVLDDGIGGRVVGWRDDDLAAMELDKWPPQPAPQRAAASRVAISMPPPQPVAPPAFVMPAPQPQVQVVTIPVAPPPPVPAPVPVVASEPVVEEDEWEWEIALARARAAAEDTVALTAKSMTLPMVSTKVEPMDTWPKTEPLGNIDYEDYTSPTREVAKPVTKPMPVVVPMPTPVPTPAPAPVSTVAPSKTVIPVPQLFATGTPRPTTLAPVVRPAASKPAITPIPPAPLRRMAKGTGSHDPRPSARHLVPAFTAPVRAPAASPETYDDKTAVEASISYRESPAGRAAAAMIPRIVRSAR